MMKRSILFISTSPNWPKTDGKRQRTWFLLEALLKEYEVDFLFIGRLTEVENIKKSGQGFRQLFFLQMDTDKCLGLVPNYLLNHKERISLKKFREAAEKCLNDIIKKEQYRLLFFRYIESYFAFDINKEMILAADIDDVYWEKQLSVISQVKSLSLKMKKVFIYFFNLRRYQKAYNRVNIKYITKAADRKKGSLKNAVVLINLPFSMYDGMIDLKQNNRKAIGFIGKLSYQPNIDGLMWFLEKVWPQLVNQVTDIQLIIAGSGNVSKSLEVLINKSVNVVNIGYVDNVSEFYNRVTATVVPVFSGGGSNIKIAESISYGKPVITSVFSAKGYDEAVNDKIVLVARNEKEWISLASFLFVDYLKAAQLSEKSISFVRENYSLDRWNDTLIANLENY